MKNNAKEAFDKKPPKAYTKYSDEDKNKARKKLRLGFQVANLIVDGKAICPLCGENRKGKFILKEENVNPYWKCYHCSNYGDVFKAMEAMGIKFSDAIAILIGKSSEFDIASLEIKIANIEIKESFTAKVDFEIYDYILEKADLVKAQEYYGQWHISPDVVEKQKARYILDAKKLENELLVKFGRERLLEAGVLMVDKNSKDLFLFSSNYPVIEPHLSPSGHVVGMQFRPSFKYLIKVSNHKKFKKLWGGQFDAQGNKIEAKEAWKKAYLENPELAGEYIPYIPPFMSIRGAGPDSLVGCGLSEIKRLTEGGKIYIVEGFKDLLASNTMKTNAYAIPGTGVMPSKKVCSLLKNYKVIIMLDGDEAGSKGRTNLKSHLIENGVDVKRLISTPKDEKEPNEEILDDDDEDLKLAKNRRVMFVVKK
jgi:5S rRNA maturation endonuclease (ribonuclease M5)